MVIWHSSRFLEFARESNADSGIESFDAIFFFEYMADRLLNDCCEMMHP